eukprot:361810-Chlamydomonas_euryale.AAC.2
MGTSSVRRSNLIRRSNLVRLSRGALQHACVSGCVDEVTHEPAACEITFLVLQCADVHRGRRPARWPCSCRPATAALYEFSVVKIMGFRMSACSSASASRMDQTGSFCSYPTARTTSNRKGKEGRGNDHKNRKAPQRTEAETGKSNSEQLDMRTCTLSTKEATALHLRLAALGKGLLELLPQSCVLKLHLCHQHLAGGLCGVVASHKHAPR